MRVGDKVVFVSDPLAYGIGRIERPMPKGRLLVAFEDGDEVMHPQEIELLAVWLDEPVRA